MVRIPIAADGWRFILPLALAGAGLIWLRQAWSLWLGGLLLLATAFCVFFFRDFNRNTVMDRAAVYSPGDGKILEVATLAEGPNKGRKIIRIFLSVFDGHVQRSPVKGVVSRVIYKEGRFLDARDIKAHVENEQNSVILETAHGPVEVIQIAGLIARRIVCWVKEGQALEQGERYGLIRFGSQVDLILPADIMPTVNVGDRVVSGETVVARWKN